MIYTFNIPTIIRRYVPTWFRHTPNLQWAYVLCCWLEHIQSDFEGWRERQIIGQYRYNGLIHSLEMMLNDGWDNITRRIYITVADQAPAYYHLGDGAPPIVQYATEGELTGYYHLADGAIAEVYEYEFLVHWPVSLSFDPESVFAKLDLYRYAGRRPAIRLFGPGDVTIEIITYPGNIPPFNQL